MSISKVNKTDGSLKRVTKSGTQEYNTLLQNTEKLTADKNTEGSVSYQINQAVGELGDKEDGTPYADVKEYIDEKTASASESVVTWSADSDGNLIAHYQYDDGT